MHTREECNKPKAKNKLIIQTVFNEIYQAF